jgi:hypothetical protein
VKHPDRREPHLHDGFRINFFPSSHLESEYLTTRRGLQVTEGTLLDMPGGFARECQVVVCLCSLRNPSASSLKQIIPCRLDPGFCKQCWLHFALRELYSGTRQWPLGC